MLEALFAFLTNHRVYNTQLQVRFLKHELCAAPSSQSKVMALLRAVWNTAAPRIPQQAAFFRNIIYPNRHQLHSFAGCLALLHGQQVAPSFQSLYKGLKKGKGNGWGGRTAALFTKHVYNIHNRYDEIAGDLAFWDDVPKQFAGDDTLNLPVDEVITHIFGALDAGTPAGQPAAFSHINNRLHQRYAGAQMEVWDDLWFWGCFTQQGSGNNRQFVDWNAEKYWAQQHTDKDLANEVQHHAAEFLTLLGNPQG